MSPAFPHTPRPSRLVSLIRPALTPLPLLAALAFAPLAFAATPGDPAREPDPEIVQLPRLDVEASLSPSIEAGTQSATAFTQAALETQGVETLTDVAALTPGLFILEQGPTAASISIRGILSESNDPRQSPRVALSLDDIPLGRPSLSGLAFFDLQDVEIRKGPQDPSLGRGAQAGALVLRSARPAPTPGGRLSLTVGELDRAALQGHVNTPLTDDGRLAARVAFLRDTRDGYVQNLAGGDALQSRDTLALRPSLLWRPTENTTVGLTVQYQRDQPTGTPFTSLAIPDSRGRIDPFGPAELNRADALGFDREVLAASLRLDHAFADSWTLSTRTSFAGNDSNEQFDGDGSRLFLLELAEDLHGRQFDQDIRLSRSFGERARLHFGGRFYHERYRRDVLIATDEGQVWPLFSGRFRSTLLAQGVPLGIVDAAAPLAVTTAPFTRQTNLPPGFAAFGLVPPLASLAPLANAPLNPRYTETYRETAAMDGGELYLGGAFRPVPPLELSASLGLVHEHQTLGYQSPFAPTPSTLGFLLGGSPNLASSPTPGGALRSASRSDHDWTARLAALLDLGPDWQAFASLARGRRPGTIVVASATNTELDPESVLAGEAGLRWRAPSRRLSAQAALFRYAYANFQTSQADPANPARFIPRDSGSLGGQGAELSARALLGESWEVFATYGLTDASFDATGDDGQPQAFAGFTPRLVSRHVLALGTTFRHGLGRAGALSVTPLVQYRSSHYFEDENDLFGGTLRQGGYTVVNLRAVWTSPAGRWQIAAFADNLLDKAWLLDAGNIGATYGIPTAVRAAPRLVGLETTLAW